MFRALLTALLAGGLVWSIAVTAGAHGEADWINRGGYKNTVGELCCGERDCFALPVGDVTVTPAGYFIRSKRETVPFNEAQPSPDGNYWRCEWGGQRKCFFTPIPTF